MTTARTRRPLAIAGGIGFMLAAAAPAAAVTIPDAVVEPGSTTVIQFRVGSCEGSATDSLVVSIPESVTDVVPQALPGWTVDTYTVADIGADEVSPSPAASPDAPLAGPGDPVRTVRWSGGTLPVGQYQEFGIQATFPDEADGPLTFPAVQVCGTTPVVWDGERDEDLPAPRVSLGEVLGPREAAALSQAVDALTADVDAITSEVEQLAESIGDANLENLRTRVRQLESADERLQGREGAITERLNRLRDRILALEEAVDEPQNGSGNAGDAANGAAEESTADG